MLRSITGCLLIGLLLVAVASEAKAQIAKAQVTDGTESLLPAGFLAEGLIPIKIRLAGEGKSAPQYDEKGELLLLTDKRIIYLNAAREVERKRPEHVLWIEALTDQNHRWVREKGSIFVGPKLTLPPINVRQVKRSAREEEQYLWSMLRRLYDGARASRGPGANEADELTASAWRKKADNCAAYLRKKGGDEKLIDAFQGFVEYLDQQTQLESKRKNALEADKQKSEIDPRMIARRRRLQAGLAGLKGVAAILAEDPNLLAGTLGVHATSQERGSRDLEQLALEKKYFKEETVAKLQAIDKEIMTARTRCQGRITAAGKHLGLPSFEQAESLIEKFSSAGDYKELVETLESLAKSWDEATGSPAPLLVAEAAWTRAVRPVGNKNHMASELIQVARSCADRVRYVPEDPFFDEDRAFILWHAASIAARAAFMHHDTKSWKDVYHPYAFYSLRLFKLAELADPKAIDVNGWSGEFRMLALALTESKDKAMQLGADLGPTRRFSTRYHFFMARLRCLDRDKAQFLEHAEQVAAFGQVALLKRCPEVIGLLNSSPGIRTEFVTRTSPHVELSCTNTQVWVKNTSRFDLTNVEGVLRLALRGGGMSEHAVSVPFLSKGEKILIPANLPADATMAALALAIKSDQGTAQVTFQASPGN